MATAIPFSINQDGRFLVSIRGYTKLNRRRKFQYSIVFILVTCLTVYIVFWNIARDEIYYLCGNFSEGVELASVISQLETANLSSYVKTEDKFGLKISFSSKLNFSIYQCSIEIDKNGEVIEATFS
jgi:hypothetical protein